MKQKKVTLNEDQKVYVIPCGEGYSCLGFQVCINRAEKLAAELGESFTGTYGTMEAYNEYEKLISIAARKHHLSGWRSTSELIPEFIGREGERVEVVDCYDNKRKFIIAKSTGFIPCHLEIEKRKDDGGVAVFGYPFKRIKFL